MEKKKLVFYMKKEKIGGNIKMTNNKHKDEIKHKHKLCYGANIKMITTSAI